MHILYDAHYRMCVCGQTPLCMDYTSSGHCINDDADAVNCDIGPSTDNERLRSSTDVHAGDNVSEYDPWLKSDIANLHGVHHVGNSGCDTAPAHEYEGIRISQDSSICSEMTESVRNAASNLSQGIGDTCRLGCFNSVRIAPHDWMICLTSWQR